VTVVDETKSVNNYKESMNSPIYVYFLFFSIAITLADANRGGLCNVFDPFKVLPDNNKVSYKI
jgi:hypothetical protein